MARAGIVVVAGLLAGCAAGGPPETAVATQAAQAQACAAAVATHVGKTTDAVTARYDAATAAGGAIFTVTDADSGAAGGERVHTCEVDAAARVLAIRHPGA